MCPLFNDAHLLNNVELVEKTHIEPLHLALWIMTRS